MGQPPTVAFPEAWPDAEELELCLIFHRLWWQARQRRLAREARAEAQSRRAGA